MSAFTSALSQMDGLSKPVIKALTKLFQLRSGLHGRHNMTQLGRNGRSSVRSIGRWLRRTFDFTSLNLQMLKSFLLDSMMPSVQQPRRLWGCVDATFLKKAGKHTPGLGYFYNGVNSRAERGMETLVIGIVDERTHTAYTLGARQTIDAVRPPEEEEKDAESKKKEKKETRMDAYVSAIVEHMDALKAFSSHIVADGGFGSSKFVSGMREHGMHVISALKKNAYLRAPLCWAERTGKRGRPPKYGERIYPDGEHELDTVVLEEKRLVLHTAIVHSTVCTEKVRVVFVKRADGELLKVLFSTDTSLSAEEIYRAYALRFQQEFVFRDSKQHLGLNDAQTRDEMVNHNHVNMTFAILNALKLDALQRWDGVGRFRFSVVSECQRRRNDSLILLFLRLSGAEMEPDKIEAAMTQLRNFAVIQP